MSDQILASDQVILRAPIPTVEQTARKLGLSREDVEAVYDILVKNGAKLKPLAPWGKRRPRAKAISEKSDPAASASTQAAGQK